MNAWTLELCPKDSQGQPLVCSGCAHSASGAQFPGHPSGERPCFFCVRNVERELWARDAAERNPVGNRHPVNGVWYDGSAAIANPMDCYHSVDMKRQFGRWVEQAKASNGNG